MFFLHDQNLTKYLFFLDLALKLSEMHFLESSDKMAFVKVNFYTLMKENIFYDWKEICDCDLSSIQ